MFTITSLGDLVADIVFTIEHLPVEHEQHQHADSLTVEPGGTGSFLIAGARLGMTMRALGTLGRDAFGDTLQQIFVDEGIDVSEIVRLPGSTTTPVLVMIDKVGQHVFIGGKQLGEEIAFSERWKLAIDSADALFLCGFVLLEPQLKSIVLPILDYARARSVPVVFDPGPFCSEVAFDVKQSIVERTTVLVLTEAEITLLNLGAADGVDLLSDFRSRDSTLLCVKRGGEGCRIFANGQVVEHPGFPIEMRDTTGAGDTFAAALTYAWLHKWSLEKVAMFANAMGAAMAQKIGSGRNAPTREEVWKILGWEE